MLNVLSFFLVRVMEYSNGIFSSVSSPILRVQVLFHSGMLEMVVFRSKQPGLVSVVLRLTQFLGSRYFLM